MPATDIFAADYREEPWWWQAAPRPASEPGPLPARADVVIVGSGFTGCSAALALARGGREVLVVDAEAPGYGASSRNAGFVGKTFKHDIGKLTGQLGEARALAVYGELAAAFEFVAELVRREQIACHFRRCGRFILARTAGQYQAMARDLAFKAARTGEQFTMVPREEQAREIGSERFHGGALVPGLGSIHPGLYQLGLMERALGAGARVVGHTPVTAIRDAGGGFNVATTRGAVAARDVVIATNGYTGRATPWQRRRVVPFRGFMIATERLDESTLARVFPARRTYHDFHNNLTFMRPAPDEPRVLFGAYTGAMTDDVGRMAGRLRARLGADLPGLQGVRVSRAWSGYCAGTFDLWPHVGVHDGVHYAMGYCYAGLPMGTWLGAKIAARILGTGDADSVFGERPFPTVPLYRGGSWPVPLIMAWYDHLDRASMRRRAPR